MSPTLVTLGWALAQTVFAATIPDRGVGCEPPPAEAVCLSRHEMAEVPEALRWAEDPSSQAGLEAMMQAEFRPFAQSRWPNLGRRSSAIWLRLPVINDLGRPTTRVIGVGWPRLRRVEGYAVTDNDMNRAHYLGVSGWEMAWEDREVAVSAHAFEVALPPGETTVYLRVVSSSELILPVAVLEWPDVVKGVRAEALWLAGYLGVVLVLALYNVWIFIRIRQRPNLLYALSAIFFLCFAMLNAGWFGALGTGVRLQAHLAWLGGLWHVARLAFTREFLRLPQVAPGLDRVLAGLQWLTLPAIGLTLWLLPLGIRDTAFAAIELPIAFATFLAGGLAFRLGVRMALWFLPAAGLLLLGLVLGHVIFAGLGLSPSFAGASILAGTLGEIVVLTVALAEQTRDVVEQREQVVRRAASHRLESLERLVAGVTHEMNSPLGALRSSVASIARAGEKLQENLPSPAPKGAVRAVAALAPLTRTSVEATERLDDVVASLKAFARLDAAKEEPADLVAGLRSGLVLLSSRLNSIEVQDTLPELPLVRCRVAEVNQAFMALLTNAVDAMPDGGRLHLSGQARVEAVEIEIEDTGGGIPAPILHHLFEPHLVRTGRRVKMGLGLSMVKSIIDAHEGHVDISSEPGVGTRVRLILPRHPVTDSGEEYGRREG